MYNKKTTAFAVLMAVIYGMCACSIIVNETPKPEIGANEVDYLTQTWVATDIPFESDVAYNDTSILKDVSLDVEFTSPSGQVYLMPAFWNGGMEWKVRFAPTEYGIWKYKTICSDTENNGLNGKTGTLGANEYNGNLDIYKHGFIKTGAEKYFTYADGTPFFYLGDTHWGMYTEEFSEAGEYAGNIQTSSHFKYIVDERVKQGFTVYQSEPISAPFNLEDGFSADDIEGFKTADEYYSYIAEKGLVHANAQFFFSSAMSYAIFKTSDELDNHEKYEYLELISRYWVARFGAYPVLWTLGQEIDNDFYYERGDQTVYDGANNPWKKVCEYINKYDPYKHPITAHQENTDFTTVTGIGRSSASAFDDVQGHTWWGCQWTPTLTGQFNFSVPRDYWKSNKPAILFESRYCGLWTKDFGARIQGWIAFLNGMYGYGYGAIDMWLYNSTYNIDADSSDGINTITAEEKKNVKWSTSLYFESAVQMGHLKNFFTSIDWYRLKPDFDEKCYSPPNVRTLHSCAYDNDSVFVLYLYSKRLESSGTLYGLDASASYTAKWFNPRTGEYTEVSNAVIPSQNNGDCYWPVPDRPNANDWVMLLTKN